MFKNLTVGSHWSVTNRNVFLSFRIAGTEGGDGETPTTHRRRLPAARARGRERRGSRAAQGRVAQPSTHSRITATSGGTGASSPAAETCG